ncbi:MAG: roadblock/LC7 domain-containing protein [Acidobacteria bacterium]|nr:roadblock/LC7 domain-containing protein [Acidobacteriota bacterium]
MTFEETVKDILQACPGATAAAIIDPDGIPVVVEPGRPEIEVLGAEMASLIREMNQAGRELDHGALRQFSAMADRVQIVLTTMAAGYFLMVLLDPDAVAGRVRLASRLAGERLHSEFV